MSEDYVKHRACRSIQSAKTMTVRAARILRSAVDTTGQIEEARLRENESENGAAGAITVRGEPTHVWRVPIRAGERPDGSVQPTKRLSAGVLNEIVPNVVSGTRGALNLFPSEEHALSRYGRQSDCCVGNRIWRLCGGHSLTTCIGYRSRLVRKAQ